MTIRMILEAPDPRLRLRSAPVEAVDEGVRQLIDDLIETMRSAGGIGLAAPQLGVPRRVIVADVSGGAEPPVALVNPELVSHELAGMCEESCLSVPGVVEAVPRDLKVRVRGLDRAGAPTELLAEGLLAACLQHELEHLDGVLFTDKLSWFKRLKVNRQLRRRAKAEPRP